MAQFFMKLLSSGYPATLRHQVIRTVCERWDKACQEEDDQTRPIHRLREWKQKERLLEKEYRILNWHKSKKDQVSAPLIVDPTSGKMASEMRDVCAKFENVTGMHVVVKERAGQKNKSISKSEPLKNKTCGRENCFPCGSGGGDCQKNGSGYRVTCLTCQRDGFKSIYEGETGRNGFTRGLEHLAALRLQDEENAMWKHCLVEHDGREAEFEMKILRTFKSCLDRQVNKAVRIIISKADIVMNSKSEFRQAPIIRVVPTTGSHEEQEGSRNNSWAGGGGGGMARGGGRGQTRGGGRGQARGGGRGQAMGRSSRGRTGDRMETR